MTTTRGFTFDPGDPSVGLFGTAWIHEDCHYSPEYNVVPEEVEDLQVAVVRVDDMTLRTWTLLTCLDCGTQTLVSEDDYSPSDEFIEAEAAAEQAAELAAERYYEEAGSRGDPYGYEMDRRMEAIEAEAEARLAQYDDDPNPYAGTYSEE